MIEINLLPESLREVEHTPLPRMIAILVGLIAFLIVSYFVYIEYITVITDLKNQISTIEDFKNSPSTRDSLNRVKNLKTAIEEKTKREEILILIVSSKIMWSKKLDEFNQLVAEKFPNTLWFDSISISASNRIDFSKSNSPIVMKMITKGHLLLANEESAPAKISELQTQLKSQENDFSANIDLSYGKFKIPSSTIIYNKEIEKRIVEFPLEITFLPQTFLSTKTTPPVNQK
jgi:hypothetical protein